MIKPSESIIRALGQLENNPAWQEIVKWIDDSLVKQSIDNNYKSGEETIKNQGRNLELDELVKHISKTHIYKNNLSK